ncbi:hypothetical protein H4N49_35265 [Streptomyces sp. DHE17-7]|nr:hypothetical protein [Streptomyces sp. DHE17-7]
MSVRARVSDTPQGGQRVDGGDAADGQGGPERTEEDDHGGRNQDGARGEEERHGGVGHECAQGGGGAGSDQGAADEQDDGLAEGVLEQADGGGAQRLEDGDVTAALDGPDGEEGADDERGDREEEAAHQLQGAVLRGVGADRRQRVVGGDRLGADPAVGGGRIGLGGGTQGDDGRARTVVGAGGRRGLLPGVQTGPQHRGVTEVGIARYGGHLQVSACQNQGVPGFDAEVVGGCGGQHHRSARDPFAVRGEAGAGLDTEDRDPGAPVSRGGSGRGDPQRLGAFDPRRPRPLLPLLFVDGGVGVRQVLPAAGSLESDLVDGQ